MRHTKIIATISDKRCEVEFIKSLFEAGMNVARINTAHITIESGKNLIQNIRAVSETIAIMLDTKGPEIRTYNIITDIEVEKGEEIAIANRTTEPDIKFFRVNYNNFVEELEISNKILIDDGDIELTVTEKHEGFIKCRVENSGFIKNKKSINLPEFDIKLPSISKKDHEFIKFAVDERVDFIAHSFVRNKKDVIRVQKLLEKYNSKIKVIAKIENLEGVENIDEILEHAYGIMVARGDLGIELPLEKIPTIQRNLVKKAILKKKPVIVATQMLHSMIEHPRPTRAEVSDVASAIYSRADAIMLSGETASGKYPVEAVQTMTKIALEVEPDLDKRYDVIQPPINNEIPAYLSQSAIKASKELGIKSIVTSTTTGRTARYLAAYRTNSIVYAMCHSKEVMREMSLSFGVVPYYLELKKNRLKIQKAAIEMVAEKNAIPENELLVYVGGRFGQESSASFVEVATVKNMINVTSIK